MSSIVYGFTPHIGQERVINTIIGGPEKYITVVSPRQIGKSILLINLILYYAINDKDNPIIGVITPVYSQAKKILEDLYAAIKDSGIIESGNFSSFSLTLKTGARIIFKSSEREDNLRGNTFDYLFLDEAAYQRKDAWENAILPTALVKGKKVVLFSTPRGRDWFYQMYMMGQDPTFTKYASVRMNQGENPLIDKSEIEAAKRALPDAVFRAEYLGEFIEGESMVFSSFKKCIATSLLRPQGKVFCGLDLGRKQDYTVATFIDERGNVIELFRQNMSTWESIINNLIVKVKKYNASILVETNSIGDVIYEQIKNRWQNTHPFNTTAQSKKDIIETLVLAFNNEEIAIPNDDDLIGELETFEMSYNPQTRNVRYAAREPFHDDMVISLALANWHRGQNKDYGNYAYIGRRKT